MPRGAAETVLLCGVPWGLTVRYLITVRYLGTVYGPSHALMARTGMLNDSSRCRKVVDNQP